MNPSASPSKPLEQLLTQHTSNFDYGTLDTETRMLIHQCTNEIKSLMRRSSQDIIDIGQKLIEVKQCLGHGRFLKWLKSEFDWSISSATKFMQVWEELRFVDFTNMNINASALYLIAAPSTSKEARAEVLERAGCGENITYTKAKEIVLQYKKAAKPKLDKPLTIDVSVETTECEERKSLRRVQHEASGAEEAEVLTRKDLKTQTHLPSSQDLMHSSEFRDQQIATTFKENRNILDYTIQTACMLNQAPISDNTLDAVTTKIAIDIKNLTPNQLALVIKKSVNNGLSNHHLEILITEAQNALNEQQR
ncbi:hypothetical protein BZZ01_09725 [Nostocales cyanobacterium HT-58-2]|nr:hypothetical protein BZZ01_09725 [Nostocales cyanobacterium HT-58-2]